MSYSNKVKTNFTLILGILLVISMGYNLFMHQKYKNVIIHDQENGEARLGLISDYGINLADNLEQFIKHASGSEDNETKSKLDSFWRIVLGDNKSIILSIGPTSPLFLEDRAPKWGLLSYSFFRIDGVITNLNLLFLEKGSYALTDEDKEKLEAVISVFRKIHNEMDKAKYPELIIDSLTEEMMIIDPLYGKTLERINSH
ncbi:hypothetical protein [Paenibacillus sp. FJAT-27812]|uniref:hypothetical protein n=1 Tax=Paenibacillus sp. FJAT-27812 TaxID=1684143 RepID=UPI0006A7A346|nr:hypothetical protein [Paenibacillus sp. FJAT-27812]